MGDIEEKKENGSSSTYKRPRYGVVAAVAIIYKILSSLIIRGALSFVWLSTPMLLALLYDNGIDLSYIGLPEYNKAYELPGYQTADAGNTGDSSSADTQNNSSFDVQQTDKKASVEFYVSVSESFDEYMNHNVTSSYSSGMIADSGYDSDSYGSDSYNSYSGYDNYSGYNNDSSYYGGYDDDYDYDDYDYDDYDDEDDYDDYDDEYDYSSEYILPDSDSRYYTMDELKGMTAEQCRLARNELYARHGRMFDDEELQSYFDSCSWYNGTIKPSDFKDLDYFNDYEIANRDLILKYEKKKGYR